MNIQCIWRLSNTLYVFDIDDFDWVYSLNHRTLPSFVAQELPRILGDFQKLGEGEGP